MSERPSVPEIRARLEAITPPPWSPPPPITPENIEFIAHAPRDIAFLLEENARLSKVILEAWQSIDHNCAAYRFLTGPAREGGSDV